MAGENVITIIGNLTREPELRSTSNGENVANFTIASSDRRFNRQTNQWEDGDTLFMNCSVWGGMAQHVAQSLHKGMGVIAQGRLKQRSYQANDGTQRTVVELRVDEIGRVFVMRLPKCRGFNVAALRRPRRAVSIRVRIMFRLTVSNSRNSQPSNHSRVPTRGERTTISLPRSATSETTLISNPD